MRHGHSLKPSTKAGFHFYSKTQPIFTTARKSLRLISCAAKQRVSSAFPFVPSTADRKIAFCTFKRPIITVNVETAGVFRKMHSYVQVLSTPTADTPGTALLLDTGQKSYLFGNIHEGLQRACIQRNARLSKTSDVFVSGTTEWKNVGGIFGVILTLADANASALRSEAERANLKKAASRDLSQATAVDEFRTKKHKEQFRAFAEAGLNPDDYFNHVKKGGNVPASLPTITLHGGRNLTHVVATGRRFIFRKGMPVEVEEAASSDESFPENRASNPDWVDDNIQVWTLPIAPVGNGMQECIAQEQPSQGRFDKSTESELPFLANEETSNRISITTGELDMQREVQDQELRKFVVSEMFNSQWRLDALVETPLHKVIMPATLWIREETSKIIKRYVPPEAEPLPDITVLVRRPWPGAQIEQLPSTTPSRIAMSYIVRHHRQRGKFNARKAEELNVNQLVWSVLQKGVTVKSKDGVTVTPEMVLEPSRPGAGFAVIDLPSKDYVQSLVKRPELSDKCLMDGIQAIFWLLGPGVAQDENFKDFLLQHNSLRHIISAPDVLPNYLAFDSSSTLVIRLNQIDPDRYCIPIHSNAKPSVLPHCSIDDIKGQNVFEATRNFQMTLEPRFEVQNRKDVQPFMNTRKVLELMPKEALTLAETARSEINSSRTIEILAGQNLASRDAEIICLGTGSSAPSKYRNVSATLLRVPDHGSYLFDCGEGTLGQLRRSFEPEELTEVLRDIKMIWISHLHADHHLGTASVIKAWQEANYAGKANVGPSTTLHDQPTSFVEAAKEKKLFVFANEHMLMWLKEYSQVEDFGYSHVIPIYAFPATLSNSNFSWMVWNGMQVGFRTRDSAINDAMKRATGMTNLVTCMVDHCIGAQAVSVTFDTGFKFSYSGDCRPCSQLVEIGRDSTVLLHEATFDDEMQSDAEAKKHSTMSEAIGVALAMNAKRLLLTHFSQRYQKIPQLGALDKIRVHFDDPQAVDNDMEGADIPNDPEIAGYHTGNRFEVEQQELSQEQLAVTPTPASADPKYRQQITFSPDAGRDLKVGIAFDFMRVRVGDITHLERFTPVIQHLFEALEGEDKGKAQDNPTETKKRTKEEEKLRKQDTYARQMEQNRLKKEANKRKQQEQAEAGRKKRDKRPSGDGMREPGWREGMRNDTMEVDSSITTPDDAIGAKNKAIADVR